MSYLVNKYDYIEKKEERHAKAIVTVKENVISFQKDNSILSKKLKRDNMNMVPLHTTKVSRTF